MSHRFKKPKNRGLTYIPPGANRTEAQLRKYAAMIKDPLQLAGIIAQMGIGKPAHVREEIQRRGLEKLREYLKFPVPDNFLVAKPEDSTVSSRTVG